MERRNGKVPRPGRGDGAAARETGGGVAPRTGEVAGIRGKNDARNGAPDQCSTERSCSPGDFGTRGSNGPYRAPPLRTRAGEYSGGGAGSAHEAHFALRGSAGDGPT